MAYRNGALATFILIALGLSATASADSLYERLGGTPVVSAFVADTIDKVAADPEIRQSLDRANLQHVKDVLTSRICTLTGGGCTSRDDSLDALRADVRLVEAMRESMRARDVPLAARNQLLEILAPISRDVAKL